jgi:hypothetical protein
VLERFRRPLVAAALAALTATTAGCFGRFPVVSVVYDFNRGVGNKFLRSLVMVVMIVIPVYEIAALADIVIFNTIEFWTGGRSVADSRTLPDGTRVDIASVSHDVLRMRTTTPDGRITDLEIVKVSPGAGIVRRPGGTILAQVELTPDGRIVSR